MKIKIKKCDHCGKESPKIFKENPRICGENHCVKPGGFYRGLGEKEGSNGKIVTWWRDEEGNYTLA